MAGITVSDLTIISCANNGVVKWGRWSLSRSISVYGYTKDGIYRGCVEEPKGIPAFRFYIATDGGITDSFYVNGVVWSSWFRSIWAQAMLKQPHLLYDIYFVRYDKHYNTDKFRLFLDAWISDSL